MSAAKGADLWDFFPLREVDIRNLVGTHQRGLGVQMFTYTKSGAGAETLTIASQNDPGGRALRPMADTDYGVMVTATNDGAAAGGIVVSATQITIPAGVFGDADTLRVLLIGQISGHPDP